MIMTDSSHWILSMAVTACFGSGFIGLGLGVKNYYYCLAGALLLVIGLIYFLSFEDVLKKEGWRGFE